MEAVYLLCAILVAVPVLYMSKATLTYILDPLSLRKYPSPGFLAAATPFWVLKEQWMQQRSRNTHYQHQKLGDVIRIAPNLLMFNIPEAVTDIYGHQAARKLVKDEFYDRQAGDDHDTVNVRDHSDHAQRRKYLSNSFALKTVTDMEPVIRDNFQRLLDHIDHSIISDESSRSGILDIRRWLNYFTLDVIGDMAFGIPLGCLADGHDDKMVQTEGNKARPISGIIETLHRGVWLANLLAQLPTGAADLAKTVAGVTGWVGRMTGSQHQKDFEDISISQLQKRLKGGDPQRPQGDFIGKILADRDGQPRQLPFRQLVAESQMLLNAGSDTTTAGLTSTLYFLLKNPHCRQKLRNEIDAKLNSFDEGIVPYDAVRDLPYLRACIDEALRLRPPIAYPLQRLVVAPEGTIIAGHAVRCGTVVAVSPWSIHRHKSLYKDPDIFDPERWFDETQLSNLRKYYIVFSQGPRQCLGRHIAIVELQIVISTLIRRYDIELLTPDQELSIYDRFNSNPGSMPVRMKRRRLPN